MSTHLISIRELKAEDCLVMANAFTAQGWNKPASKFEQYLAEQKIGQRLALIAEFEGAFAGYLTVVWESDYPPFREASIPEIVDFNVLLKYRRRGIGTVLMDSAEKSISGRSDIAGIGVGLMSDYGNAQILYVKREYIPDGRGIYANGRWLEYGDQLTVDDDVTLYLTKTVGKTSS
jgi:GNAT superfamily N-acetyltransferase